MNTKITAYLLTLALLFASAPAAFAKKQMGDWNSLASRANNEIAVKALDQKTIFGILLAANETEITIRVSSDTLSPRAFRRDQVEKIWLAEIRDGRRTGLGAGVGAAAGAGFGLAIVASVPNRERDGLEGLAVPFLAVIGAGVGGVIGYFAKKGNRKRALIYQR